MNTSFETNTPANPGKRNRADALLVRLYRLFLMLAVTAAMASPAAAQQFLWGAATSSYQVEGGITCSNPSLPCNDYDFFNSNPLIQFRVAANTSNEGPSALLAPAGVADNGWDPATYKRDFDNARLLGMNAFRFSIEWSRIEPTPPTENPDGSFTHTWDRDAIQHYSDMIDEMIKRGLTPVLTLHHMTLPVWLLRPPQLTLELTLEVLGVTKKIDFALDSDSGFKDSKKGWENPQTIDLYVDFTKQMVKEFGSRVRYWITINEPVASQVVLGYIAGVWSPGFVLDGDRAKKVLHNLIVGHVRAYEAIHDCSINLGCGAAMAGVAHAMGATVPSPPGFLGSAPANGIAEFNFSYFINDYFINAITSGAEDTNYLNSLFSDQGINVTPHDEWKNHVDFLGINYYRRFHVFQDDLLTVKGVGFLGGHVHNNMFGEPEPHELLNDLGWTMYPQGLHDLIMQAKNHWHLPVLITENGIPERDDRNRAPHLVGHLQQVAQAMAEGANVIGYLHWSLMDNWELHENYHPAAQFGLFHIDRSVTDENGTPVLHRAITEGALAYKQIIDESRALRTDGAPSLTALDAAGGKFGQLTSDGMQIFPPRVTHGRFYADRSGSEPITLYITSIVNSGEYTGLIRRGQQDWHNLNVHLVPQGVLLHESWFDDANGTVAENDLPVSFANGTLTGPGFTASQIPATGLWKWEGGQSPWGADFFYISNFEGTYAGKHMIFSQPSSRDVPDCGLEGCVPQVSGATWREIAGVQFDSASSPNLMVLDGRGRENENLFDISLSLTGNDATTVAPKSDSFVAFKVPASGVPFVDAPFFLTGYVAPSDDNLWLGFRGGSNNSFFAFLEKRGLFLEAPIQTAPIGGVSNQYYKENEPFSVMPLVGFSFVDNGHFGHSISWQAGGRSYSLDTGFPSCAGATFECSGTWSDMPGLVAHRVPEDFTPLVDQLKDVTIEADAAGGANVTLSTHAVDLDNKDLTYVWTVDNVETLGANPTVFLRLGSHAVCVIVSKSFSSVARCATFTVVDTTPPAIQINQPANAQYQHSTTLTLDYSATDIATGVATLTSQLDGSSTLNGQTLASGLNINLLQDLGLGLHTFTVNAVDNAGNATSSSVTFTVITTPNAIRDDVSQFFATGAIRNRGLVGSLLAKLDAAAAARAKGDCDTAANTYRAFIHEVTAQSGQGIEAQAAAVMIGDAQYLIAHCP